MPQVTDRFDEDRFAALLDLAGSDLAPELARRLDEDLTNVGAALTKAPADMTMMQAQSHILVSIAGTIGATKLYQLAKQFNTSALLVDPGGVALNATELRMVLNEVIVRIRATRFDLDRAP